MVKGQVGEEMTGNDFFRLAKSQNEIRNGASSGQRPHSNAQVSYLNFYADERLQAL